MDLEKKIRSIHDLLQKKKFLQVKEELEKQGLVVSGMSPDNNLIEISNEI